MVLGSRCQLRSTFEIFIGTLSDVLDEGGPLANVPKTWSFIEARDFLARHLLANDSI
jgi:hypothetical protein